MEGDAGTRQLNPDDEAAEESESSADENVSTDSEVSEDAQDVNDADGGVDDADDNVEGAEDTEAGEPDQADQGKVVPDRGASADDDSRSRLYSRGWAVGTCVTLLVLSLLIVGAGLLTLRANQHNDARLAAEEAAVRAAKDCVTATQAPDVSVMAASQQKIIECATGDFGAQATLYSGMLVDAYQVANAHLEVANIRAAPERHNDDGSIDVLVALKVKMTNSSVQDQTIGYRLRVKMAEEDGVYKIAKLDQVTK